MRMDGAPAAVSTGPEERLTPAVHRLYRCPTGVARGAARWEGESTVSSVGPQECVYGIV